jgi:flagellar motor switch protein FliN/FliY
MGRGAVVQLNRMIGDEIEIYANNQLIALAEVVVVDDQLGVSLTKIIKSNFIHLVDE